MTIKPVLSREIIAVINKVEENLTWCEGILYHSDHLTYPDFNALNYAVKELISLILTGEDK